MKKPLYSQALKQSWQLAWRHKILWIFGLFATFLGQMGILEILIKVGKAGSTYAVYPNWLALPKFFRFTLGEMSVSGDKLLWLVCLGLIIFGFILFFTYLAVVSQGAIIYTSAKVFKSRSKKLPNVGLAWHKGVEHFGRLFFINFFKKLIVISLAVIVGWSTLNVLYTGSGFDVLIFFLVFLIACVVGFVLSFLSVYAAGYVVVEEYGLWEAIKSSWSLFVNHWLVSIEVGLIILLLNFAVAIVTVLGFFVFFFPTIILWFISVLTANIVLYTLGMFLGLILFTAFIVFLGSLFTVFTTSTWTYLFMKMHKTGIASRIIHILSHKKK